jgi:hypothetical protein
MERRVEWRRSRRRYPPSISLETTRTGDPYRSLMSDKLKTIASRRRGTVLPARGRESTEEGRTNLTPSHSCDCVPRFLFLMQEP